MATVAGEILAVNPADGSVIWSVSGSVPFTAPSKLAVLELASGGVLLAITDLVGNVRAVRDDGATGTLLSWFRLPDGTPGAAQAPPVQSVSSRILADRRGLGLVGADDGWVYPVDLLKGTVGAPLDAAPTTESVTQLALEAPGRFASPASFLASSSDGMVARYCTTLGAPPAVPVLGPPGLILLVGGLVAAGVAASRRRG